MTRRAYTFTIADMMRLAEARGGVVVSTVYRGDAGELEWRCAENHVWRAPPNRIKSGRWCRVCAREARRARPTDEGLAPLRIEARRRGGELLSTQMLKVILPLRWRCAQGHEWYASWNNVRKGTWCPTCAQRAPLTLLRLREHARSQGGACLADEVHDSKTPLRWRCTLGHTWKAAPSNVLRGTWCPTCRKPPPTTAPELADIAVARGGRCISPATSARRRATWECAEGHVWKASPDAIKSGSWCPVCYVGEEPTIAQMRRVAAAKRGKVLSRKYENDRTPLEWKCKEGHVWWAAPNQIKAGRWCAVCAYASRRGVPRPKPTLEDLQALAAAQGGRCVSPNYRGASVAHEWECAEGHVWPATHGSIRKGTWCPTCDHERRRRRAHLAVGRGPLAAKPQRVEGAERRVARRRPLP